MTHPRFNILDVSCLFIPILPLRVPPSPFLMERGRGYYAKIGFQQRSALLESYFCDYQRESGIHTHSLAAPAQECRE